MSMIINIPYEFKQLMDADSPFYDGAMEAGATGVRNTLQRYYRKKGFDEPNRLGGKRTNFWADIARSVQTPTKRFRDWLVAILDTRIWQKIKGGPITAKEKEWLTIPIHRDAHGRRASELQIELGIRLFKVKSQAGNYILMGAKDGEKAVPYYLLKKSVNQKPWPGSLPEDFEIINAFNEGVSEYMRAQKSLS